MYLFPSSQSFEWVQIPLEPLNLLALKKSVQLTVKVGRSGRKHLGVETSLLKRDKFNHNILIYTILCVFRGKMTVRTYLRDVSIVFLVTMTVLILSLNGTMAQPTFPKAVTGYVWDSAGAPLEYADITVNLKNGKLIKDTQTDATDSSGEYSVSFSSCEDGWVIEVIATYNSNQETNSTAADSSSLQWVNVTFPFEIPVFGNLLGFLIAGGLLGTIVAVSLRRKTIN